MSGCRARATRQRDTPAEGRLITPPLDPNLTVEME
jgi:hypothetical protein